MALWGIITSAVAVVLSVVGLVILLGVVADLGEEGAVETGSTVSPATESCFATGRDVPAAAGRGNSARGGRRG